MTARITAAATLIHLNVPTDDNPQRQLEFFVSPLSDRDWDELEDWIQTQHIRLARKSLDDDCTQRERDETLAVAVREAGQVSLVSSQGAQYLHSIHGLARLMWHSLRHRHPTLTIEEARGYLLNPANATEFTEAFGRANSLSSNGEQKKTGGARAEEKRSPRR
jgi:hypothetical protein